MTNFALCLILVLPLILGVLMLLVKKKGFDNFCLNIYAVFHFISTIFLVFWGETPLNETQGAYFAVDSINKIFLLILSFVFLMVTIYNNGYSRHLNVFSSLKILDKKICLYWITTLGFVWAMSGAVLAADLGIAWVLVEATTLSSAYLIYFNRTKNSIEAAWKYVFICSIGIALAFVGIIFLNISSETVNSLNYAVLAENAKSFDPLWLKLAFIFILAGFGTKMGLAPVHFWLPDAHAESPSPISALLSATLLNSAFLVILKSFNILNIAGCSSYARVMLAVMGFLSIFTAAVFIYHIKNYKRMLAYSSIENMGILAIGAALGGVGYYAMLLHLIGHSLSKASFFLTSGNILELFETKRIKSVNGIMKADSKTGWLWIASFLAICALPTSVLFISEFLIIKALIERGEYLACAAFVLLLTVILYGISKVTIKMTFGKLSEDKAEVVKKNLSKITPSMYLPQVVMLVIVFVLGVYIPPFLYDIINSALGAL